MFIGLQYIMLYGFNRVQSSIIIDLLKQTEQNHDMKDELNQILENLEESIIIMSDNRAEFVNQRFLCNFSKHIMNKIPDQPDTEVRKEAPSRLTRIKQYLKKKFSRGNNR